MHNCVIYCTRLCDVWSSFPYHSVSDEYYNKLQATCGNNFPDNVTIETLTKEFKFA